MAEAHESPIAPTPSESSTKDPLFDIKVRNAERILEELSKKQQATAPAAEPKSSILNRSMGRRALLSGALGLAGLGVAKYAGVFDEKPAPVEPVTPKVVETIAPAIQVAPKPQKVAITEPVKSTEPVKTPEAKIATCGWGEFNQPNPTLLDIATGQPTPTPGFSRFELVGYGKDKTFRLLDPKTKKIYDSPIEQCKIIEGSPVKEVPAVAFLGVRNNDAELMSFVPEIGASKVRIASNNNSFEDLDLQKALRSAKDKGIKILYVYNPDHLPTTPQIQEHLKNVLTGYNVDLEIGNEPDETTNGYWKDFQKNPGDFRSFATFVKTTIDEARKIKPDVKIIIGASSAPELYQKSMVAELKKAGVDTSSVSSAVHAYSDEEVERRIPIVQEATGQKDVVVTELGYEKDDPEKIPSLINKARAQGVGDVFIHELGRHQSTWGLIDPGGSRLKNAKFWLMQLATLRNQFNPSPPEQSTAPRTKEQAILFPSELNPQQVKEWVGKLRDGHDAVITESLFMQEVARFPEPKRDELLRQVAIGHAEGIIAKYGDTNAIIGLDPGHGFTDIGASGVTQSGETLAEKDVNWKTANMVAEELYKQTKGKYTVVMLRPEIPKDQDLDGDGVISVVERLQKRKALLLDTERKLRPDPKDRGKNIAYISIHFNGSPDAGQEGIEMYWPNPFGVPNNGIRESSKELALSLQEKIKKRIQNWGYNPKDRGAKEDPDTRAPRANADGVFGPYVVLGSPKLDRILG